MEVWGLSREQRRGLYLAVLNVLRAVGNQASETLRFQIKYLETFSGEGEDFPEEVLALASDVLVVGVTSPVSSCQERNTLLQVRTPTSFLDILSPLELLETCLQPDAGSSARAAAHSL